MYLSFMVSISLVGSLSIFINELLKETALGSINFFGFVFLVLIHRLRSYSYDFFSSIYFDFIYPLHSQLPKVPLKVIGLKPHLF